MIRTGPAGWSYPDSPGHVYPADVPARFDALAYLATYFDTVEVNATFYRPQPARNYRSWAQRVRHNPAFRFTVKLWQRFTHEPSAVGREGSGMRDDAPTRPSGARPAWTPDEVRQVTEGLGVLRDEERLGALLAQFPWSFKPGDGSRAWLERLAADLADWPVVVEVRHGAWGRPENAAFLRQLGVGLANIDQPVIGQSLKPAALATSAVGYVRFHGRNYDRWFERGEDAAQRYNYLYTPDELAPWIERIRALDSTPGVADVYVILNNHYQGKGPANALMIRSMLEGRKIEAPPVLFEKYRHLLEQYAVSGSQ